MVIGLVDVPRFPEHAWSILPDLQGVLDGVIVRDKQDQAPSVWSAANKIRATAPDLPLWINSYLSVAVLLSAEGLALPANFVSASFIQSVWTKPIMASVHNLEDLRYHRQADFYLWGHAFPSTSKPGLRPRAWSELKRIVQLADVPVLAIGGVSVHNIGQLAGTGIEGVCLSDGLWLESDPLEAARQIRQYVLSSDWKRSGGVQCD
ncbi:MAG: thiamine phosphate synthase [Firmicutes bacterium]|jgi:thiamine-phosphate diphosphorylase|uniref:Thiamine phosphate synthase/TenI domain-containing protein n=1 Tax=Sulfobacillus benefaciens TaxID=453960 RepID=A0A2T2WQD3_9FIRM|nr:thiamine phosphate synthase [Bacillota bacterium]MCL5013479.1 thiamine phosphate synthase [Bacillota bacterium]PSR24447.1 MAG: hypothetical protein C7B43_19025 [Sulfobacillus benefaciens]